MPRGGDGVLDHTSIALIAVGLVLALAVTVDLNGTDLRLVGWILAVVGLIGLAVSLLIARRNRTVVAREEYPPARPRDY